MTSAVQVIKEAILQSQQRALRAVNQEQLALYYGIGRYVSLNTRKKNWGKGAIEAISSQLRKELPGLKGFSARNIKNMRTFYEEWHFLENANSAVRKDGPFQTAYLGQLAGYLRLLDDLVRKPNENPSIGILLCKSANKKFVEYVIQDYDKPMGVATYKTSSDMNDKMKQLLPPVEELEKLL